MIAMIENITKYSTKIKSKILHQKNPPPTREDFTSLSKKKSKFFADYKRTN